MPESKELQLPVNLELDQEDLDGLEFDNGAKALDPGAAETAELEEADKNPGARKRRQSFSVAHKIRILTELKAGISVSQILKTHRLTKSSLALIACDDTLQELTNADYVDKTKKLTASRFYQLADLALSHIDPQKLQRLDAYKLGMLAAIALDKARLIEGQPTEYLSFKSLAMNIHGTLSDLQTRKQELIQLLALRGKGIESTSIRAES